MCTYVYKCGGKSENVYTGNNSRKVNIFLPQVLEIQTSHELLVQASQFDIFLHVTKICHNYTAGTFKVHTFQPNSVSGVALYIHLIHVMSKNYSISISFHQYNFACITPNIWVKELGVNPVWLHNQKGSLWWFSHLIRKYPGLYPALLHIRLVWEYLMISKKERRVWRSI